MKSLVICGPRGVGKTTLANRIIENSERKIYGFFTKKYPEMMIDGLCPIYIYPAAGNPVFDHGHLVGLGGEGTHYINTEVFDTTGVKLLECDDKNGLIIMDEIGFLECEAKAFQKKVMECLHGDIPVIVMMKQKLGEEFLRNVFALKDEGVVEYIEITEENRDAVFEKIASGGILKLPD